MLRERGACSCWTAGIQVWHAIGVAAQLWRLRQGRVHSGNRAGPDYDWHGEPLAQQPHPAALPSCPDTLCQVFALLHASMCCLGVRCEHVHHTAQPAAQAVAAAAAASASAAAKMHAHHVDTSRHA